MFSPNHCQMMPGFRPHFFLLPKTPVIQRPLAQSFSRPIARQSVKNIFSGNRRRRNKSSQTRLRYPECVTQYAQVRTRHATR